MQQPAKRFQDLIVWQKAHRLVHLDKGVLSAAGA